MVYIAPLPGTNQPNQHGPVKKVAGRLPKAHAEPQQHHDNSRPARVKSRNQQPANANSLDVQKSKQELLQELTRQAEWNTLVLQREQAALRALQESQVGSLAVQASALTVAVAALDVMGPPPGLAPVATKAKNHRFFDVAPKVVDPKQVPGLSAAPAAAASAMKAGGQQRMQDARQQHTGSAKAPAAAAQRLPARPQQVNASGGAAAANRVPAAGKQQQHQQLGHNAPRHMQQAVGVEAALAKRQVASKAKSGNTKAAGEAAAQADLAAVPDGNWQDAVDVAGQLSPFAAADWRFEYPDAGPSQRSEQQQQGMLAQTFPDTPQFRPGMVFEIPTHDGLSTNGQQAAQPCGGPGAAPLYCAGPACCAGQGMPLAQLVEQQQRQADFEWMGTNDGQTLSGGSLPIPGNALQQQQQQQCAQAPVQPHLLLQSCQTLDELAEAMRRAQACPDPVLRMQLVKELKQKQYKLELQAQIAEREAARQAAKAAAATREAAEEAARAAAPPPWDPAARAHRLGGGGEPLLSMDGMPVADLRAMRDRLPVQGVESFLTIGTAPQQQQQVLLQLQASHSDGQAQLVQSGGGPSDMGNATNSIAQLPLPHSITGDMVQVVAAPAAISAANKGFLGALNELKAGPSIEQRAAAAAARQQLINDLQLQVAEKAARAAQEAAAEAARTRRDEEALRRYYNQQQAAQNVSNMLQNANPLGLSTQDHSNLNPQPWGQCMGGLGGGLTSNQAGGVSGLGGSASGHAMLQAAAEASSRAVNTGAAVADSSSGQAPRKGRSKKVIEAPWLDQLQQQQQGQPTQQQRSQQGLAGQSSSYTVGVQVAPQQQQSTSSNMQPSTNTALPTVQQSGASGATAANAEHLSTEQLATALHELQQQQTQMWEEFTWQTKVLERLLHDKQVSSVADSNTAWVELQRVRDVLQKAQEQQQALQQTLEDRQQQLRVDKGQRHGHQQQQQQGLLSQQHSTVQISATPQHQHKQLGHDISDKLDGDALDAFMVETQLVPVTLNTIPDSPGVGCSLMQLMLPPRAEGGRCGGYPCQPVHHCNRYATNGLDAELSSCSIASNKQYGKASARASSNTACKQWPNNQQQLSQRPPASPPILRSDRFADKPADSKHAGRSVGDGSARYRHGKGSGGGSSGPVNKTKSRITAAGGAKSHAPQRLPA